MVNIDERIAVSRLFTNEAEVHVNSYNRRFGLADTRAAVLIGASAISVSVADLAVAGLWLYVSVGLGFLAALAGVLGLMARKSAHLNWVNLRDELLVLQEAHALVWLGDKKLQVSALNEGRLGRKNLILNAGFIALGLSVLFSAAAMTGLSISIGGITIG